MYQPGSAFEETRSHLIQQGLVVHETSHFLYAIGQGHQPTTLVHRLSTHEVDNNIGYYLMRELASRELITTDTDFGAALIAVVTSIAPQNPVEAWNLFSLNTLQRLREKLNNLSSSPDGQDFISPFAHIYHRLLQLKIGSSLLDVGCACAFWPVLAAENTQTRTEKIIGVDSRSDAIALSNNLASAANMTHIEFIQTDLLAQEFLLVGIFDTVTAIALMEHIPEKHLPQAFDHLLSVTRQRLIISVPYEEQATLAYGHQQIFTRKKLEQWGKWCIEHLQGQGRFWCEDVMGGLLVVERQ
ncbi:MAG TPA: class I SAM-dependent methyltransferase [Ktedonobacteraceae bacterium]|nr:class I SAM-dependent methyltransferase [Ktedonobacteraceae bacterium]